MVQVDMTTITKRKGLDYPYGYVRWTENRNMAEYLRLLHNGAIDISQMVNARLPY